MTGAAGVSDLALGPGGMKVLTGNFSESVDFGAGPLIEPEPFHGEGDVVKGPLW